MVANIRSGSSPGGALYYNKEKVDRDEAEILYWQKMLEPFDKHGRMDVDACMESFRPYLEANRRTANTVFHVSLNPSPEDKLTDEQLREIANEYMQKMGYGNQPYIVFKHTDIDREHLHIVSLRIDENGRKLSHDYEARRSMDILRSLEQKYGLHPSVKGQELTDRESLRKVNYPEGNVKQQVSSVVRSCLRNYKCSSYGEFRTLLERFNVSIEERTGTIDGRSYAGIVYGAMTDDGYGIGTPFKSSKIGKDVGYRALQKYYEKSKCQLKEEGALDRLRQCVRDAMRPHNTRDEFRRLLKADNIDAIFRINPVGRIYGATFIDHNMGIVANGSLLGKEFSANAFNELYPAPKGMRQVAERRSEQRQEQRRHTANPISGIVDTILDLADTQAYEEQQRRIQRRKKRKLHR
ncbi:MAG: relaxase/mobilization nuclease domain-containing protein [Alistipes sp.]|uniref:conjugal transfer protein MobB n=1 Tax=Alistipes sp. TaxID=1872444 RepID=UPI001D6AE797|nr:conjugal transfer protein MobB [Alistipes sp.]MBS5021329.1 relaxase/mobilization nuclease domain-containing protein [Alistipes sp.]